MLKVLEGRLTPWNPINDSGQMGTKCQLQTTKQPPQSAEFLTSPGKPYLTARPMQDYWCGVSVTSHTLTC